MQGSCRSQYLFVCVCWRRASHPASMRTASRHASESRWETRDNDRCLCITMPFPTYHYQLCCRFSTDRGAQTSINTLTRAETNAPLQSELLRASSVLAVQSCGEADLCAFLQTSTRVSAAAYGGLRCWCCGARTSKESQHGSILKVMACMGRLTPLLPNLPEPACWLYCVLSEALQIVW